MEHEDDKSVVDVTAGETRIQGTARPENWDEYVGNTKVKERLETLIKEAETNDTAIPHLLFSGPPGLGKSELAYLISKRLGVGFRIVRDPSITKEIDIRKILAKIERRDVFQIDEIDDLRRGRKILYSAMQDFMIDDEEDGTIYLPKFTLIGTSTHVGRLKQALKDRFGLPLAFDFYPPEDLAEILRRLAQALNVVIEEEAALEIARRSLGTPRVAKTLFSRVLSRAKENGHRVITLSIAMDGLKYWGIDELGLNEMHYKYMHALIKTHWGGPIGPRTLALALGVELVVIQEMEQCLVRAGMVELDPQHKRKATRRAHEYFKDRWAEGVKRASA
jgi:Holliday junction DNA helicase RuvB